MSENNNGDSLWDHELICEAPGDVDLESLVAAHYAVHLEMSYDRIAAMMGLSRASVARRLQHARLKGWLLQPELVVPEDHMADFERKVRCVSLGDKLVELLSPYGLRRATVVPDQRTLPDLEHEVSQRVAQAAAIRVSDALMERERERSQRRLSGRSRERIVGINWGYSVRWVVQFLRHPELLNPRLQFVPLLGNFSIDEANEKEFEEAWLCSSNRLARQASEIFGARQPRRLTTPAVIPNVFEKGNLTTIWRFIEEDISYQRVFGRGHHRPLPGTNGEEAHTGESLLGRMDTMITGMSALDAGSSLATMTGLIDETTDLARLKAAGYRGDLGGHLIMDPEDPVTDPEMMAVAESLSKRIVSPTPQDFTRVARRSVAEKNTNTGVFMVGVMKPEESNNGSPGKAGAFLAACRMGAVNELFTDRATAAKMLRLLGIDPDNIESESL